MIKSKHSNVVAILAVVVLTLATAPLQAARRCKLDCNFSGGKMKCSRGSTASCSCTGTGHFSGACVTMDGLNVVDIIRFSAGEVTVWSSDYQISKSDEFQVALEKLGPSWYSLSDSIGAATSAAYLGDSVMYEQCLGDIQTAVASTGSPMAANVASEAGIFAAIEESIDATWTAWLDRDNWSGSGDYETLSAFLAQGQACESPQAIECETTSGVPWDEAGQVYTCDPQIGGVCVNANQTNGYCSDYRVRFLCEIE